jgi:uncharacterized protein YidB (DUF937 family)
MALLDDLLNSMLDQGQGGAGRPQAAPVNQTQLGGLAQAVITMLNDPRVGGIDGLMRRFQEAGLGDVASSWIGTGQNRPIDPSQLERVFPDDVTRMAQQVGLPPQQGGSLLAQLLPALIDQLTPQGRVPQQNQMSDLTGQLLKSLLR